MRRCLPSEQTYVVGRIRMVVNAAKEGSGSVLADEPGDEMCTAGVLFDESCHVMNETRDENERALGRLTLN